MEAIMMTPEPLFMPWDDKELEVSPVHWVLTCLTFLDRDWLQLVGTASATSMQGIALLACGWSPTHVRNPVGPASGKNQFA